MIWAKRKIGRRVTVLTKVFFKRKCMAVLPCGQKSIGRNTEVTSLPSWPGRKAGFHSTLVDGGRGGGTLSETKTQNENICYLCNIKTKT